jgi:hypothetical protein
MQFYRRSEQLKASSRNLVTLFHKTEMTFTRLKNCLTTMSKHLTSLLIALPKPQCPVRGKAKPPTARSFGASQKDFVSHKGTCFLSLLHAFPDSFH